MDAQLRDSETQEVELAVPALDVCIRSADGTPLTLPPAEYKEFCNCLFRAIASAMKPTGILIGDHQKILHIDNFEQHNQTYSLLTHDNTDVERGIRKLLIAIGSRDYQDLSELCQHYLRKIAKLATTHQYDIGFNATGIDGVLPTTAGYSCSFDIPEEPPLGEESTIFGRLLAIDKENLRIKLQPSHGHILDLAVSAEIVATLEQKKKINKAIVLIGTEYVRMSDNVTVGFEVSELSPYDSDIPPSETFRRLKKVVGNQWDHLKTQEDVDTFVNELKSLA